MINIFIVAFQPANVTANQPVAVYYPNPLHTAPGTDMPLLDARSHQGFHGALRHGIVSGDGTHHHSGLRSRIKWPSLRHRAFRLARSHARHRPTRTGRIAAGTLWRGHPGGLTHQPGNGKVPGARNSICPLPGKPSIRLMRNTDQRQDADREPSAWVATPRLSILTWTRPRAQSALAFNLVHARPAPVCFRPPGRWHHDQCRHLRSARGPLMTNRQ